MIDKGFGSVSNGPPTRLSRPALDAGAAMTKIVRDILYVATDPYAVDDDWCNAFAAFPDRKPLAHLLRTISTPYGARGLLAEMLDPSDPPITDYELVPKQIKKFGKMLDHLEITQAYTDKREAGQSAQDAAIEADAVRTDRATSVRPRCRMTPV